MRRRVTVVAMAVFTAVFVSAWATPALSARTGSSRRAALVHAEIRKVADSLTLPVIGDHGDRAATSELRSLAPEATTIAAKARFDMVGVLLRVPNHGSPASLRVMVRTSLDAVVWSDWWRLPLDAAGPEGSVQNRLDRMSDPAWVGPSRYLQYTVNGAALPGYPTAPGRIVDLRFVLLDAEGSDSRTVRQTGNAGSLGAAFSGPGLVGPARASTTAASEAPAIVTRAQWGADESWRTGSPQYAPVKMAFVHHTDGSNDYSPSQSAAILRGIYYYHTKVRGWNDIGYNFLVDRFGTIFEGRAGDVTRGVVGAQVYGFNTGSTGVAVMGTFMQVRPPAIAVSSLERLLAWKLGVNGIDPSGTALMTAGATEKFVAGQVVALPTIAGHRQANFTSCPGDAFFPLLPAIRAAVADMTTPRLRVSNLAVSTPVISPNGDGRLDTAVMSLTISEPADWRIIVRRPDGRQARQYSGRGSAAAVTWDGRDQKGVIVADGDYTLLASATSPFGAARTVSSKVTVDTMAPTILSINLRPAVLSPNGDGVADVVRLDVKTSEPARGRLSVAKRASATRRYPWTSSIADTQTFAWDGTGVLGDVTSPAPDGRYSLTVEVRDRAGNQTAISRSVRLDRTLGFASVSPAWFSPNGDGRADTAILRFRLFSPAMVRVVIAGAAGSVRTFDLGSRASGSVTVKWNGRGKAGTLLPDGTYRLTATAANAAGRVSLSGRVVVDTTAPVLKVARSLMSSGDSTATISFVASDVGASEVRVWATAQGATHTAVRIFTSWVSAGRAHSFEFDPPAPGTYVITLHAEDRACNPAAIARTTLIAP